jgi:hypothetical protein
MQSRRASVQIELENNNIKIPAVPGGVTSPTATMIAFRDQLAAQIQQLQQTMHQNLPNLPQMPDYQAYLGTTPMVRRISSLVSDSLLFVADKT